MEVVKKKFLGKTFSYMSEVGPAGQVLWTAEIDNQFSKWLHTLREKKRELFKIQYSISATAYSVMEKIRAQVGIGDDSLLVRAITIIFINFIDTHRGKAILRKLSRYKGKGDLTTLQQGGRLKKNLYFSPAGMRDVEAYANLTGLKKSNVVKNALYSILLLSINEDKEIKKFWETQILERLQMIVKAG